MSPELTAAMDQFEVSMEDFENFSYLIQVRTGLGGRNWLYYTGYAHALGKTPIYIAAAGTKLEFDLKDYPVIFFKNLRELKQELERRLRAIAADETAG